MNEIYAKYLESPGTKAYTLAEAKELTRQFSDVKIQVKMSFGDLLEGKVGQRHKGPLLLLAKLIYPKAIIRLLGKILPIGLLLLISARKPLGPPC